jgi:hypothetical protein
MEHREVVADRVVDTVVIASGATVLIDKVESFALIFSLLAGGTYYAIKALHAWRNGRD